MPEIVTRSAANPEFARVVDLAALRGRAEFAFDLTPTPAETAALARLMDVVALRKLRFQGRLTQAAGAALRLEAMLRVTAVQTCVVSLDPVTTRIDTAVHRLFVPGFDADPAEIDPNSSDDDETEPLTDRIDLGLVAIEALALALPAYPRAEGARLAALSSAPAGVAPLQDGEVKPFAALAALRPKLGEGS